MILSGSPAMQNTWPNQILGIPHSGPQIGPFRVTSTFSKLEAPNLQILQIGDLQGMSTNSGISFQNLDSMFVH